MPESANFFFAYYHTLTSWLCRWCARGVSVPAPALAPRRRLCMADGANAREGGPRASVYVDRG